MKPAAGLFSRTEEGSFTVEMALIFPAILLLIVAVMEIGMWYRIRIMTDTGIQEALMLIETARSRGYSLEEAVMFADEWIEEGLDGIGDYSRYWDIRDSFLKESVTLTVQGSYGNILPLFYEERQQFCHPDPRRFRDRVDLICEKLKAK